MCLTVRPGGQHGADNGELRSRECRLAAKVRRVLAALGVLDAGPLAPLGRFGLCLGGRGHEAYQRVPHGLLNRVIGRAVEREVVDDAPDYDAAAHELADGVANVVLVATHTVNPAHDQHVTGPEGHGSGDLGSNGVGRGAHSQPIGGNPVAAGQDE